MKLTEAIAIILSFHDITDRYVDEDFDELGKHNPAVLEAYKVLMAERDSE